MRMYGDLYDPNFEWDKTSSKANNKEIREIAKRDAKSILKTGLGLFKNDTTVKQYIQERRPHEELIIHVDPLDEIDELMKQKQPKKDTKIRKWVKAMREESEKENAKKEEFDFD
jgi:predicted nucleic acid-binding protein